MITMSGVVACSKEGKYLKRMLCGLAYLALVAVDENRMIGAVQYYRQCGRDVAL